MLAGHRSAGPDAAFIRRRGFASFHPVPDSSVHLALPERVADVAIEREWAEFHLIARTEELPGSVVMIYAPRDRDEAETVWTLLRASHESPPRRDRQARAQLQRLGVETVQGRRQECFDEA